MKKLLVLIFTIVFMAISSSAMAGKDSGLYLGGSLGLSSLDIAEEDFDFDDDDQGFKVFAGYNFGLIPMFDLAIEGSYVDFGEANATILEQDLDVGITAYDLFGVAGYNIGPVGIFGKVGHVWWDSESHSVPDLDASSSDMAYGIGLKVQFGSLAVRAEYERFEGDVADVDLISAGVSWTF